MAQILIIDDDPDSRKLLRLRLENSGHTVQEAADGPEGLRLTENRRPALVFLDVRLPKMDGWQVCRDLKSNPETNQIPVVMLTGCSQDAQELYGRSCGADEYITKPWEGKHLLEVVDTMLSRSEASQDVKSSVMQQRSKQFAQRMIQLAGKLCTVPNAEQITGQLLRLSALFISNYQMAVSAAAKTFLPKLKTVDQDMGELMYWLGLLRDSNVSTDPEIPLLAAEGKVLQRLFGDYLKNSTQP